MADPATAEDMLQDVFLKLQSRLDEFRDPAKVQGWLLLVARNAIIDYYRTRKPTSELEESLTRAALSTCRRQKSNFLSVSRSAIN